MSELLKLFFQRFRYFLPWFFNTPVFQIPSGALKIPLLLCPSIHFQEISLCCFLLISFLDLFSQNIDFHINRFHLCFSSKRNISRKAEFFLLLFTLLGMIKHALIERDKNQMSIIYLFLRFSTLILFFQDIESCSPLTHSKKT